MDDTIVIVSAQRTPMGGFQGALSSLSANELGAYAISACLEKVSFPREDVSEVLMGCVLQAGQGQAPARQAGIKAGLPQSVSATTLNKMCGSGLKTIMLAHDLLQSGEYKALVAGGMESMTKAPYLLDKARDGYRMAHHKVYDHMFLDGLEDAYDKGQLMGTYAERTAEKYQFSREAQDNFALTSLSRAQTAINSGYFEQEIIPVTYKTKKGEVTVTVDEQPGQARPDKIPTLKPAFKKDGGTVTAANSSSISDGAAAVLMMTESEAKRRNLQPLARIVSHAQYAREPEWFTLAPVDAIRNAMAKASWQVNDVDLFEINEAFAVVTMAAMRDLEISHEKVNIHGGACALGHPIGASGARILTTLIHALERTQQTKGVAALCIGGGEGVAMCIERLT